MQHIKIFINSILLVLALLMSAGQLAAKPDNSGYQYGLGWEAYESGHYLEAFRIWKKLAQQNHVLAQINLGAMYDAGQGVPENPTKAIKYFTPAARMGNPYAQYNLGNMYAEGRGVKRNADIAASWYHKAAEQGLAIAQYCLGLFYASRIDSAAPIDGKQREISLKWLYRSGMSYLANGQIEEAEKARHSMAGISYRHPLTDRLLNKIRSQREGKHCESRLSDLSGASTGTGWPVSSGHIITNYHVVADSQEIQIQDIQGRQLKAWTILRDEANDIAILEVEDPSRLPPALPLADDAISLGSQVFTIGFPRVDVLGMFPKLTRGTISKLTGPASDDNSCQTTVSIQPGNSGGPLLNMKGEVVGVVRAMLAFRHSDSGEMIFLENASSALKVEYVLKALKHLPDRKLVLPTLPNSKADIDTLASRLNDSLLIVITR
jgi:S1-C subfamily serine protease